jgi:transposase
VHLTETCDSDKPHLITHVETTPATTGDVEMTEIIHEALAAQDLLPGEHLVDTAYVDAQHLLTSQLSMTLTWLGLFLVIVAGKPKPLKVLTCLFSS